MVTISCAGKFHAFNLAEQLEKHGLLSGLLTTYAYPKNTLMRRFTSRVDKEQIPVEKIRTAVPLAVGMKVWEKPVLWDALFDRWAAGQMANQRASKVFIGWSGMSLHALRKAKEQGKITVLERGSSHICYQDTILHDEYKKFGIRFRIDPRTVEKELKEYAEADYISIASTFVKKSFMEYGIPASKLVLNPYGSSSYFQRVDSGLPKGDNKFRVIYLGSLLIRKGLYYLFQALQRLHIPEDRFEAWFIGKVDDEIKSTVEKYARPNWKFFGHVNHYDLPKHISACDVAVVPSLEDGFGMVILQMLSCGVPVIATTNTGGPDVIREGENGHIVPVRDPDAIAGHIQVLHDDPARLARMKENAAAIGIREWSWDQYGERYADFIRKVV